MTWHDSVRKKPPSQMRPTSSMITTVLCVVRSPTILKELLKGFSMNPVFFAYIGL